MGKGRFTALDTRAMASEVRDKLLGCRIANIYDMNTRTYLLKFSGNDKRSFLLIESGIRFHLTSFERDLPEMPNGFCSKLRKHLKSKKLTKISQLGKDRIVQLTFGTNPQFTYHLIIELYSGGNIILTNNNFLILACQRVVVPAAALKALNTPNASETAPNDAKDAKDANASKASNAPNTSQIVRPKETYTFANITEDKAFDPAHVESKLRQEVGKLVKQRQQQEAPAKGAKGAKQGKKQKQQENVKLSKRQLRRQMRNKACETVGEFIIATMGTSPIIAESCMLKCNVSKGDDLLQMVASPLPHLKASDAANKKNQGNGGKNGKFGKNGKNGKQSDDAAATTRGPHRSGKKKAKHLKKQQEEKKQEEAKALKHSKRDFGGSDEIMIGALSSSDESSDDAQSEDSDHDDDTREDDMYNGLNEEKKLQVMILDVNRLEALLACYREYDALLANMKVNVVQGYIVSKLEKIVEMKEINIFYKPQRKKMVMPSIEIDHDSKQIIEKPAQEVRADPKVSKSLSDSKQSDAAPQDSNPSNPPNAPNPANTAESAAPNAPEPSESKANDAASAAPTSPANLTNPANPAVAATDAPDGDKSEFMYDEFLPCELYNSSQLERDSGDKIKISAFGTFGSAVDAFYASVESLKSEMKQSRNEQFAWKKLFKAKTQHEERIQHLEGEASQHEFLAHLILENLEFVDRAIDGVNILLRQGESWHDLSNRIREDAMYGNPIARLIVSLKLHENVITLKLPHVEEEAVVSEAASDAADAEQNDDNEDDDESSDVSDMFDDDEDAGGNDGNDAAAVNAVVRTEYHKIDVNLGLSGWNNARKYFQHKKSYLDKRDKTMDATQLAMKAAEVKTRQALEEAKLVSRIKSMRRTFWFEKFYWFISSDNYLVIGGRDAQQNELIVKKYMDREYDIYVHAHIHGASSVVIKNIKNNAEDGKERIGITKDLVTSLKQKFGNKYDISKHRRYFDVPERTLNEAGAMCVCRSVAWKNNVTTQAYWVFGYQVSKTAPTQEYLPTGSFVIRGKKNFIMPQPLIMGCVVMFKIDRSSWERNHSHERSVKYLDGSDGRSGSNSSSERSGSSASRSGSEDEANEENGRDLRLKKEEDESAVYITKTMVQVTARDREARKKQKEKEKAREKEQGIKKAKKKMNKKLAKYGMIGKQADKDNDDESSQQSGGKGRNNKKNGRNNNNNNRNKRKGNSYRNKYGSEDEVYVKQLLGIKDPPKDEDTSGKDDKDAKNAKNSKKEQEEKMKKLESERQGYELTEKTQKEKERLRQFEESEAKNEKDGKEVNEEKEEKKALGEDENNNENNNNNNNNEEEENEVDEFDLQRQHTITNTIENEMRLLTGDPKNNDTILYALPMCAPWSVTNSDNYQFKIKIQPGKQRRGTAVKHVMKILDSMCDVGGSKNKKKRNDLNALKSENNEEDEENEEKNDNVVGQIVSCIKDTEVSSVFLSDVKISASGLREIEENERKKKQMAQKQQWQENLMNQKRAEMQNREIRDKLKSVQPKKRKKKSKN